MQAIPDYSTKLTLDTTEFNKTFNELSSLSALAEVSDEVFRFLEVSLELISFDLIGSSACGACEYRVLLKPSDSLLNFMTTLRARNT